MEVREQISGDGSLHPLFLRFWEPKAGDEACLLNALSADLSGWPSSFVVLEFGWSCLTHVDVAKIKVSVVIILPSSVNPAFGFLSLSSQSAFTDLLSPFTPASEATVDWASWGLGVLFLPAPHFKGPADTPESAQTQ